jgi:endonuclease YncB( thermonuclease family)
MLLCAWYFEQKSNPPRTTKVEGKKLLVMDGDSFAIGEDRFRLKGIDAPELHQTCKDERGQDWECGATARQALVDLLSEPRLSCDSEVADRYHRALATCTTIRSTDIASDQVRDGMAVSDDFYGLRSYGEEEDRATLEKRGIWRGDFMPPDEWRATHPRADQPTLRTNTVPAE